jgi:hypothetical protein
MKKWLLFLFITIVASLVLGLSACGGGNSASTGNSPSAPSSTPSSAPELVAYLTADNDPNKYYDSYTVKTDEFGVTAWVQIPKGKTVSGAVKFFKINYDGVIEKTPWDSVRGFKTNSNGEPVSISGMSGRIPPGIYHFQIAVEDDILADLKLIIP